jgi:hypothetical protein
MKTAAKVLLYPFAALGIALCMVVMFWIGLTHMCVSRATTGRWWP